MNTQKEPAMATTPESFVDALNSAFGKQTTLEFGPLLSFRFTSGVDESSLTALDVPPDRPSEEEELE
jgi:hypothetical protein